MYNQKSLITSTLLLSLGYLVTIPYINPFILSTIILLDLGHLVLQSNYGDLNRNTLYTKYFSILKEIMFTNKNNVISMIVRLFINSFIQISFFMFWQYINQWYSKDKSISAIGSIYALFIVKLLGAVFNNKQYFYIEKTLSLPLKGLVNTYFIEQVYKSDPYNLDRCTHSELIIARDKLLDSLQSVPENVIHMINHGLKLVIHYILLYIFYYDICIYTITIHYLFFRLFSVKEIIRIQKKEQNINDNNDKFKLKLDNIHHDYNLHIMQQKGLHSDTISRHVGNLCKKDEDNRLETAIQWSDYYDIYHVIYQLNDFGILFIYCLFNYDNLSFSNMFIVTSGPGAWCIDYIIRSIQECIPKIIKFQTYLNLIEELNKPHDRLECVDYIDNEFVIHGIHLIQSGTYRLVGPVGSGKTTIIRELAFCYDDSRDEMCYLPQRNMSTYDKQKLVDCIVGIYPKDESLVDRVLEIVHIKYKKEDILNKPSGGETQMIHIAKSIYVALVKDNVRWLCLDEYDNNLDQEIQDKILHNIRNAFPQTVLLYTSHKTNTLKSISIKV
jgi:ABC-type cobalamin/Fe3+-siderophores transport system ATPase subunit